MRYHDVFNGDADGICALHPLRLADPVESTLGHRSHGGFGPG